LIWPSTFQPVAMLFGHRRGRRNSRNGHRTSSFGNNGRGRRAHRPGAVSMGKRSLGALLHHFQTGHRGPHHGCVDALCALVGIAGLMGVGSNASEAVPVDGGVGSMCGKGGGVRGLSRLGVFLGSALAWGASFASMGRLPASLFSPVDCLGRPFPTRGAVSWSASAPPSSHFLSIVHAVAFRIVCGKLAPGVGLPAFLCATPWVSMAALRSLFAMPVSNQSCGLAALECA
jgi:hypothetical protein